MKKIYKHKYKKELGWDEELMRFIIKAVSGAVLFFAVAIGIDAYQIFR